MLDLNDIKNRMSDLMVTQVELAEKIGEKQQTVSAWFSRGRIPKEKIIKVINALGMDIKDHAHYSNNHDNTLTIKIATVEAGAGLAFDIDTVDEYTNDGSIQISSNNVNYTSERSLVAIRVNGKSMLPTLLPDDMVVVDLGSSRYTGDDLYVFNYAGNLLVKRLQYNPSNNSFVVISDNKEFQTYSISLEQDQSYFKIVGKVISIISR